MTEKRIGRGRKGCGTMIPPLYEPPPPWIPAQERWSNPNYNSNLITFLPRTVVLERFEDEPHGFNIRGGRANEYGVYISKVGLM